MTTQLTISIASFKKFSPNFSLMSANPKPEVVSATIDETPFEAFVDALELYDQFDQPQAVKKTANPLNFAKSLTQSLTGSGAKKQKDRKSIRFKDFSTYHYFSFYLLNLSLGEIYESYKIFYKEFDHDDSLKIEKEEYFALLDYFARPENMGRDKILSSFKVLAPEDYTNYIKLAPKAKSSKLETDLKQAFFDSIKIKEKLPNQLVAIEYVNYLHFFPVMLSYFAEFVRRRIILRTTNLEIMRGIDKDFEELPRNINSLYGKLKSLGVTLKKGAPSPSITIKQLERMLILFRASYSEAFSNDQIKMVLAELTKKVKKKTDENGEGKPILLTWNLLDWIAYRVCLHSSLANIIHLHTQKSESATPASVPRYAVFEEYTMWAAAYRLSRYTRAGLETWFNKYAKKYIEIDPEWEQTGSEYQAYVTEHLKKFMRKIFPHINNNLVEKMSANFFPNRVGTDANKTTVETLAFHMYDISQEVVYERIKEIVMTIHEGVSKAMGKDKKPKTSESGGGGVLKWFNKRITAAGSGGSKDGSPSNKISGAAKLDFKGAADVSKDKGSDSDTSMMKLGATPKASGSVAEKHSFSDMTLLDNADDQPLKGKKKWYGLKGKKNADPAKSKFAQAVDQANIQTQEPKPSAADNAMLSRRGSTQLNAVITQQLRPQSRQELDRVIAHQSSQDSQPHIQREATTINDLENGENSRELENQFNQRFTRNPSTGRRPDVLNSFFIVESFLEKFLLKGPRKEDFIESPVKTENNNNNEEEEQQEEDEKDIDEERDEIRTKGSQVLDVSNSRIESGLGSAEKKNLSSAEPQLSDLKLLGRQYTSSPGVPESGDKQKIHALPVQNSFMSSNPKPVKMNSKLHLSLTTSNQKLVDYTTQSSRIGGQQSIFSYDFEEREGQDNDDDLIEEIQFYRLSGGKTRNTANPGAVKPRDQSGLCGYSNQKCTIF